MYIAGLNFGLSHSQGVEGLVAFTTVVETIAMIRFIRKRVKASEAEAGSIKPLPPTFVAKYITPIHTIALLSAPTLYVVATGLNRFEQPQWLLPLSFPAAWDEMLGMGGKALVRTAACIASVGCYALFRSAVLHLGSQAHHIGVRFSSYSAQLSSFTDCCPPVCRSARRPRSSRMALTLTFVIPCTPPSSSKDFCYPPCYGRSRLSPPSLLQLLLLP
jgi:hypothetical protein